jgi:uncharacterized protein
MPTKDSYLPGTPCWVDLGTTDPEAARSFYGELFGWTAEVDERPEAGGYAQFHMKGRPVAGVGGIFTEGMPPAWTTYIASADVKATAASITEHGGAVMMDPFDVLDAGCMTVFASPDGAIAGIWQPIKHQGAGIVNEPFAWCWSDLATRDVEATRSFYEKVFGWKLKSDPTWGEFMSLEEREIATISELGPQMPPQVPAHWRVAFLVDDAEATIARAQELGGTPHGPVTDFASGGRTGALADPQGAQFGVMSFPSQG